jgi:hypothetical protein
MTDETREGRSTRWAVVLALLLLPALYALSLGPVKLAVVHTGQGVRAYVTFYRPLFWLHDHTPLRGPLEWYVERWNLT